VSEDTRAKLLGKVKDLDSIHDANWVEWLTPEAQQGIDYFKNINTDDKVEFDKFIRRAPSRSRRE